MLEKWVKELDGKSGMESLLKRTRKALTLKNISVLKIVEMVRFVKEYEKLIISFRVDFQKISRRNLTIDSSLWCILLFECGDSCGNLHRLIYPHQPLHVTGHGKPRPSNGNSFRHSQYEIGSSLELRSKNYVPDLTFSFSFVALVRSWTQPHLQLEYH